MDGIGRQGVSDIALDRFAGTILRFADFNDTVSAQPADQPASKEPAEPRSDGRDVQLRPDRHHRHGMQPADRNPINARQESTLAEPFLAEIRIMSFDFAPKGWALCNGQLLPINQNQALFCAARHDLRRRRPGQLRPAGPPGPGADPRRHRAHARRAGRRAGTHAVDRGAAAAQAHDERLGHERRRRLSRRQPGRAVQPAVRPGRPSHRPRPVEQREPGRLARRTSTCSRSLTLNFCIALQGIFPSPN